MDNNLDEALQRAGDGAFVTGSDGRILSWNRAAERILGYRARDVVGRACCDVFMGYDEHDNRLCYRGCHVRALLGQGDTVENFDMRTRSKTGSPVWLNFSILATGSGSPAGLTMHLFRDVTAARELMRLVHERLAAAAGQQAGGAAETLTRREIEILRLLAAGVAARDIAERLHLSRATVKNHVQNVLTKLGAHSRLEAVAYAQRHRLL